MYFTCIWEFEVAADKLPAFLRCYGPDGDWAALFRRAPGYLGTRLLRDQARPTRFVTVDRWRSVEAYEAFKKRFGAEYDVLDRYGEGLTVHEASLGSYREYAEEAG